MENMLREADVGAHKWRRTGVYTFTGDNKSEKRMTFKKLSQHCGETSIRLFCSCAHWNKRRMSSNWYKRVAIIKYQRPRKGFSVKYKGDTKWSRALYKCRDKLQIDGSQILPNRDDQGGLCLNSTFPHKNIPSLNVHSSNLTAHTDFLNKHQT